MIIPPRNKVNKAINYTVYDFGNAQLYRMCAEHFAHTSMDVILAKTLIIGRTYAAALERRKNKSGKTNEDFYQKEVVPVFKQKFIDRKLALFRTLQLDAKSVSKFLKLHYKLQTKLNRITGLQNRSFVSKYLHFHLRDWYFIYDSRAEKAMRKYKIRISNKELDKYDRISTDDKYLIFTLKCMMLQRAIKEKHRIDLTTRQLDNLLLHVK